jgi:AcrR family transcriptional regulator
MVKTDTMPKPDEGASSTKGERTRRRLMDSALELLAEVGFHDLKTTEIARHASMAAGVFYTYFSDKNEIVLALMDEMIARNTAIVLNAPHEDDHYQAVLSANRAYVSLFANGRGLNRAIGQIVDALPEARAAWQKANADIAGKIAARMRRRLGEGPHAVDPFFGALALQAMLDSILLQTYSYRDPALAAFRDDPERLAAQLSLLWFRAVYGTDPKDQNA